MSTDVMVILLEIGALVVSITWVVAQIRGSTRELNITIFQLRDTITELKGVITRLDDRVSDHTERITRLEAHIGRCQWRENHGN